MESRVRRTTRRVETGFEGICSQDGQLDLSISSFITNRETPAITEYCCVSAKTTISPLRKKTSYWSAETDEAIRRHFGYSPNLKYTRSIVFQRAKFPSAFKARQSEFSDSWLPTVPLESETVPTRR